MNPSSQVPPSHKPQTVARPPSAPPFSFSGMEDAPPGVRFRRTEDGFEASASIANALMILIYGGVSGFLSIGLIGGLLEDNPPWAFVAFMAGFLTITVSITLFYIFGREGITIKGDRMKLRKTFLGLGFPRSMAWRTIEQVRVRRFKEEGGPLNSIWMTGERLPMGNLNRRFLEIESETQIKRMGFNLTDEQLYYFRYLIVESVKASRNQNSQR